MDTHEANSKSDHRAGPGPRPFGFGSSEIFQPPESLVSDENFASSWKWNQDPQRGLVSCDFFSIALSS